MAFPQSNLPVTVVMQFDGSTWTDVSSKVRYEDKIRISRGRSDWGQQVDYGRCTFTLDNNSGNYSPRNPVGAYYGQIGRNTPVRVSVDTGSVALWLPGGSSLDTISTPDTAVLDITGDIDVRLDATFLNWYLSDTALGDGTQSILTEMIGKYQTSTQQSWTLYSANGFLVFQWSTTGANTVSATSTVKFPVPASGRLAIRATLDVDNGAGGYDVKFYTAPNIGGTWVQLGATVTGGSTTSIFSSTADLHIGNGIKGALYTAPIGHVHAAQVYNGISGTLVASPDFTAQTSGTTSFADSAGRTWTIGGNAEITNRKVRFAGEVSAWNIRWDTGGFDVTTQVEAAGVMRRLGVGAVPVKSPMYREFTSSSRSSIVAYWPMEDASDATSLASALDGHPSMQITQTVTPAAYSAWGASDAVPTITSGLLDAVVPAYTSTGFMFLRTFVAVPAAGVVSTQRLVSVSCSGTARKWSVYMNTSGQLDLRAYDGDGTQILATGFNTFTMNGQQKSLGVELTQSGADISYKLFVYDITLSTLATASAGAISGTLATRTVGIATRVKIGEDGALNTTAFGHLAIGDSSTAFASTAGALLGWNGETATSRVHRIGFEERIDAYATSAGNEQMGTQARSTALELMRASGEADEGILGEQRDIAGIRHVSLVSHYNQLPALTLFYDSATGPLVAPLDPTDDDQGATNDVTVARDTGSSARRFLETGVLSTQAPPNGIGLYDTSFTLNLFNDTQPAHHAQWRLHIGTWDETRYPQVSVNLAADATYIDTAAAVDTGSRIQIMNAPAWLPPDTIDLLVQGYSEVIDQRAWSIVYNCTPYGPYNVAIESDGTYDRADTAASQLASAATSTATTIDVLTTTDPVWNTSVSQLPFDIRVAGEVMEVRPAGTVLTANPSFETDTTGWSSTNATLTRSTTVRRVGSASALLTTTAGSDPRVEDTLRAVTVGNTYTALGWLYAPAMLPTVVGININWFTSGFAYLSTSANTTTLTVGKWTPFNLQAVAPATAAYGSVQFAVSGTPGAGYQLYGDNVMLIAGSTGIASWLSDALGRTVSNGWGTADSGQVWSTAGGVAANFAVGSGYGSATLTTVSDSRRTLVASVFPDTDFYGSITTSASATGDSLFGSLMARYTDVDNLYMARLEFTTANAIVLSVRKRVAAAETSLGSFTSALTHVAGTFVRVRFKVSGTSLRAKVWSLSVSEPVDWQVDVTDTSLASGTSTGTRSVAAAANTNVNPAVRYDNLEIVNPQTFSVVRSVNTVVKAQASGAGVVLAYPAVVPL